MLLFPSAIKSSADQDFDARCRLEMHDSQEQQIRFLLDSSRGLVVRVASHGAPERAERRVSSMDDLFADASKTGALAR